MAADPSGALLSTHRPQELDTWMVLAPGDPAEHIQSSFRQCTDAHAHIESPHQSPAQSCRSLLRYGLRHPPVPIVALDHRSPTYESPHPQRPSETQWTVVGHTRSFSALPP